MTATHAIFGGCIAVAILCIALLLVRGYILDSMSRRQLLLEQQIRELRQQWEQHQADAQAWRTEFEASQRSPWTIHKNGTR